jgi:acylphosphatase
VRKRVQVFYSGHVQGVGFRYSVKYIAHGYEVTGFVRNLDDGRVELVAEGEETELKEFLEAITASQLGSCIRNAAADWLPATGEFKSFSITF